MAVAYGGGTAPTARAPRKVVSMTAGRGSDALVELIATRHMGVLATIKSDGRPQLSNVSYAFTADPSAPGTGVVRISITTGRAKYRNLVRDPRASLHVSAPDFWSYAVGEALAELSRAGHRPAGSDRRGPRHALPRHPG